MGIFDRMNRVIKSNLNSLMDQAEDPEKLIGQTVIEMEAELKRAKKELVSTLGTSKRLLKKAEEHEAEAAKWENKAALALRSGDESLAREALKQKMRETKRASDVRNQALASDHAASEMKNTLESMELKVDELKARKTALAAQVRTARKAGPDGGRFGEGSAFAELDRMAGRIEQLDAEVEAAHILDDPERLAVEAKFRELESQSEGGQVDDALAALKAKLKDS